MNWNKTNTLRTIGSTPAVALPYEYTIERHIRNTQPKRSPLDIYGIREKLPTKLPTILGAVSLLNWCHHLSTPRNLSVVAALGTEQLTLAYAEVLVDLGLFEQSGREVQAIEEASIPIINGAVVFCGRGK